MKIVLLILGLLIGSLGMYLAYPQLNPDEAAVCDAKVQEVNGVYVYIMAQPKREYEVIDLLSEKNIVEMGQDIGNALVIKAKACYNV